MSYPGHLTAGWKGFSIRRTLSGLRAGGQGPIQYKGRCGRFNTQQRHEERTPTALPVPASPPTQFRRFHNLLWKLFEPENASFLPPMLKELKKRRRDRRKCFTEKLCARRHTTPISFKTQNPVKLIETSPFLNN